LKEEEQNTDLRRKLRNLPGIKASDDFENKLLRRINTLEAEEAKQKEKAEERTSNKLGFFDGFLGKRRPVWFIPALSAAVLAVVALTVTLYINSGNNSKISEATYTQNHSLDSDSTGKINGISKDGGIPGKDIANDMAIGKPDNLEQPSEIESGQTEFETRTDSKTGDVLKKNEPLRESQPVIEYQNGKSKINDTQRINTELPKKEGGITPKNDGGYVPQKDEKLNDNILNRELPAVQPSKDKATSPPPTGIIKGNEEQGKAADKVKTEDKSGGPVKSTVKDKDTSKDKKKDIINKPADENKENKKEVRQKPPVDIKKQEPRNPPVDKEAPKKPPVDIKKEEPKKPPVEIKKEDPDKSKERNNDKNN